MTCFISPQIPLLFAASPFLLVSFFLTCSFLFSPILLHPDSQDFHHYDYLSFCFLPFILFLLSHPLLPTLPTLFSLSSLALKLHRDWSSPPMTTHPFCLTLQVFCSILLVSRLRSSHSYHVFIFSSAQAPFLSS